VAAAIKIDLFPIKRLPRAVSFKRMLGWRGRPRTLECFLWQWERWGWAPRAIREPKPCPEGSTPPKAAWLVASPLGNVLDWVGTHENSLWSRSA